MKPARLAGRVALLSPLPAQAAAAAESRGNLFGNQVRGDGPAPVLSSMRASRCPPGNSPTKDLVPGRVALFGVAAAAMIAAAGWLVGTGLHPLVVVAVFAGALVAGLAGFAFSAVAAAVLAHWLAPIAFVPLLLACSITTQLFSIARLWRTMQWRRAAPFVLGGLAGIPFGAAVLRDTDPHRFAAGFGAFLIAYGAFMLLRPNLVVRRGNRVVDAACGALGGVMAGAIAFPGAAPTIWCSLRGLAKDTQRGVVQPFILAIQIATLVYFSRLGILTSATIASYLVCAPAVLFGAWLGLGLFTRIDDAAFRRIVLVFLIVSGASLVF